jgi:hypothetical protein
MPKNRVKIKNKVVVCLGFAVLVDRDDGVKDAS